MSDFQAGQLIKTASGGSLEIERKLGQGGQGAVYKVKYQGRSLALKWYTTPVSREFHANIVRNIAKGSPSPEFLWPLEITEQLDNSFGYLMELRPSRYVDFSHFLLAKVHFGSLDALVNAAMHIVDGFRSLHDKGYSYQDLNDGNFFIDPKTGEVLICDNDNVAPYGTALGIAGKCRYMAPEVVLGKKLPDSHTDRFSLAVVLYLMMFLNHPLEGRATLCPCLTEEYERHFYGEAPLFVYDPANAANRPESQVHRNEVRLWPVFPEYIHEMFYKAFSQDALIGRDVTHRVLERDWLMALVRLRSDIFNCSCGEQSFLNAPASPHRCIHCAKEYPRFNCLHSSKFDIPLLAGAKLCSYLTEGNLDYQTVSAEVVGSLFDASVVGLRNLSSDTWQITDSAGNRQPLAPGKTVKLSAGARLECSGGITFTVVERQ